MQMHLLNSAAIIIPINVNGGTLRLTGTNSTNRAFTVGANGATIEVPTGSIYTKIAGDVASQNIIFNNGNGNLTLTGGGTGTIEMCWELKVVTGLGVPPRVLSRIGTGTWTLTGANTYTGTTSVNAGTLLVNNTTGSGTGTGAVNVAALATLGGTGTISGLTTVASTGVLSPNTTGTIGTLNLTGGLTTTGASLVFDLGTPMSSDLINTGVLTTTGGGNCLYFCWYASRWELYAD